MEIGPVQVVVLGFPAGEAFGEAMLRELQEVRGRGVIRLVDALFVRRADDGTLSVMEAMAKAGESDRRPVGVALRRLAGLGTRAAEDGAGEENDDCSMFGLSPAQLLETLGAIPPGGGGALVLFEHAWAARLAHVVREEGGRMLAHGILTREAMRQAGAELRVLAEAEAVMEVADAVRSAGLLDALAYASDEAEASDLAASLPSALAAQTLRALIVARLIDDAEAEPALMELIDAGLIDPVIAERAVQEAETLTLNTTAVD
ncbi:DUF6325 family protein [Longimicrobium sp.]|uniref:DUF6325 family protein n=1 Tax=Longimicrobium sp. TaxID=2029185 RepID=UPI002E35C77D|nr:DUF6325 family protein [Longimicrobium sp.]HEX6038678.1 DUF6325 family protein [Longimicrobium sp.]